jgi:hypothetical protein
MGLALLDPSYDLVRAGGLEPPRGCPQRIFVPATAFAAPPSRTRRRVRGLDYPFTLPRQSGSMILSENRYQLFGTMLHRGLGAARLVSTPSRFRAWLGIAIAGFPEFGQFCVRGFPRRTQTFKSVASAIPPRPRGATAIPADGRCAKRIGARGSCVHAGAAAGPKRARPAARRGLTLDTR